MGLFGKSGSSTSTSRSSPRDQVREWASKLRKQTYVLDRQIRGIQREEAKVKQSLKQAAKKGDREVCVILAKEIVRSRKAINRITTTKAQLNSVGLHMQQQAATLRVAGAMQKSSDVMQAMGRLVKVQEISETMRELSKEMTRAGIIDELMEETLEGLDEEEDLEEEVQAEVDKVLYELTAGQLGTAPAAVRDSLPASTTTPSKVAEDENEDEEEIEEMKKRLEALKS